ncbi:hypothetical protein TYRP_023521 [Tyrophagus putrescentiae]|nr:hypothetical protein TYRP_023521 [Tyrophagus putrescentiae]
MDSNLGRRISMSIRVISQALEDNFPSKTLIPLAAKLLQDIRSLPIINSFYLQDLESLRCTFRQNG